MYPIALLSWLHGQIKRGLTQINTSRCYSNSRLWRRCTENQPTRIVGFCFQRNTEPKCHHSCTWPGLLRSTREKMLQLTRCCFFVSFLLNLKKQSVLFLNGDYKHVWSLGRARTFSNYLLLYSREWTAQLVVQLKNKCLSLNNHDFITVQFLLASSDDIKGSVSHPSSPAESTTLRGWKH